MRDNISSKQVKFVLADSVSDNTAQVGAVIDRQGYDSLGYLIVTGSLADADVTFTVLLEESDEASTNFAAVADADMISQTSGTAPETAAGFTFTHDDNVRKLGYIGNKRYTRLTITPANNASAAIIGAVAVLENAEQKPVVQAAA